MLKCSSQFVCKSFVLFCCFTENENDSRVVDSGFGLQYAHPWGQPPPNVDDDDPRATARNHH